MPAEIRRATPGDGDRLAEIDALVSDNPWSAGQFDVACRNIGRSEVADTRETALVLEVETRVRAFLVYSRVLDDASIHNIAVHPAQQGRGLGRALLQAALEQMRREGARRCLLEVRASNGAARGLYRASRFGLDGVRKNYYPAQAGREDALLMSRQL